MPSDSGSIRDYVAKTADYTILKTDNGTCFTNRGAGGAVILTLPAPYANGRFRFIVIAAQTLTVATAIADTLIGYNDLDLDNLTSNTIGAVMEFYCDGTSWICAGIQNGVTYTLND